MGESAPTQRLRHVLDDLNWKKHAFEIKKVVDGVETESTTHEIDHVRRLKAGTFALEIEWNNKDPFFDRDLENFKRLHADGVISVGAIITRGSSLHADIREIIASFASKAGIRSIAQVSKFYSPTKRQIDNIERATEFKQSFVDGWAHAFASDKFGEATTHWAKLEERVRRGVGNPCPLLLVGIPANVVTV